MDWKEAVDRYFKVSERGSKLGREVKSGIATFLTASYILLVNPQILGAAGLPVKGVVAATALSSALASLMCGLTSNLPVSISPGMGLNAYLVYSQVLGLGTSVEKALACCFTAACVVGLLAAARALSAVLRFVPHSIKLAVVVGMGLLLTFIGLQTSKLDFSDLFSRAPSAAAWSAVLAYTLVMVFDIGGAMFGLANLAGLLQNNHVKGATWTYLGAAAGTALGALTGTTPLIIAAESAAIPQLATAPVLVLVGCMMLGEVTHIDWGCMLTAVPAFLTVVVQPFTFSIANGIYAGLVMHALLWLLTGQFLDLLPGGGGDKALEPPLSPRADLEVPFLDGAGAGAGHGHRAPAHLPPGSPRLIPVGPLAAAERVLSRFSGSLSGSSPGAALGTSYERTSYQVYINTAGSLTCTSVDSHTRRSMGGPGSSAAHSMGEPGH
eukprot:scaffold2.g7307.t1